MSERNGSEELVIVVTSASSLWTSETGTGRMHGRNIFQYPIIDEEEDFNSLPRIRGTKIDPEEYMEVKHWVERWIRKESEKALQEITRRKNSDSGSILHFSIRGIDDIQCGPICAIYFADLLRGKIGNQFPIIIRHLTMELSRQIVFFKLENRDKEHIVITSGGKNWIGGKCPQDNGKYYTIQDREIFPIYHDLEELMDDPVDKLPQEGGTDSGIQTAILGTDGVSEWCDKTFHEVREEIEKLPDGGSDLRVHHLEERCKGGFQRSVVIAESMGQRLRAWNQKSGGLRHIIVHHMTMDLALAVKEIINPQS